MKRKSAVAPTAAHNKKPNVTSSSSISSGSSGSSSGSKQGLVHRHKEQAFLQWLEAHGARVHPGLHFRVFGDSCRGVACSSSLPAEAELFSIPHGLCISASTCAAASIIAVADLGDWNALILACMLEHARGPQSKFKAYIDLLPVQDPTQAQAAHDSPPLETPLYWTPEQLTWLLGTGVVQRLGWDGIRSSYRERVLPMLRAHPDVFGAAFDSDGEATGFYSLANFVAWGSVVMSYSFCTDRGEMAMVPLADMLNAAPMRNNAKLFEPGHSEQEEDPAEHSERDEAQEQGGGVFTMSTITPVEADSELYNTYGDHSDAELLRRYGYVSHGPRNPHDSVAMGGTQLFLQTVLYDNANDAGKAADENWRHRRHAYLARTGVVDPISSSHPSSSFAQAPGGAASAAANEEVQQGPDAFEVDAEGFPNAELWAALAVATMDEQHFASAFGAAREDQDDEDDEADENGELQCPPDEWISGSRLLQAYRRLLKARMAMFPRTLAQDSAWLAANPAPKHPSAVQAESEAEAEKSRSCWRQHAATRIRHSQLLALQNGQERTLAELRAAAQRMAEESESESDAEGQEEEDEDDDDDDEEEEEV